MEELTKEFNGKILSLRFSLTKSDEVIASQNAEAISRHEALLMSKLQSAHTVKESIIELKFTNGESEEEVSTWVKEHDKFLKEADEKALAIRQLVGKMEEDKRLADRMESDKKEMALAKMKPEERMSHERELLDQQVRFQKAVEASQQEQNAKKTVTAKLPKLSITKFDGTLANWPPFWNKFEAEIDKTELAPVTKFAYLKELVEPKVRADIDGLPLNTEGYERAKNIIKEEYGKTSEIVNAYVNNILELPTVTNADPNRVNSFYKTLLFNVQSLETLGKIERVNGMTRSVLDKLKGIKADLVRGQENWQDWDLPRLTQALKKWRDVNPATEENNVANKSTLPKRPEKKSPLYHAENRNQRLCVYCDDANHISRDCTRVSTMDERKRMLARKRMCFNCTGPKHHAAECKSKMRCQKCGQKHHTSICNQGDQLMTATGNKGRVVYPVVKVSVEGVLCRSLLDTGAGSSYASAALLEKLPKRPRAKEVRRIEMMLGSTTREVELSTIKVRSTDGSEELNVDVTKVERRELLMIDNPHYQKIINSYDHLKGVEMTDCDPKPHLPVHLILGASEYAAIKTSERPRVGLPGEPVAEKTKLGWTIMSPGTEIDHGNMLLTQTSHVDYAELCRLDVLGLEDTPEHDQRAVYAEFREQLVRHPEGWYEASLPWKGNHPPLPNNKEVSLRRLSNLHNRLRRLDVTETYAEIIGKQKSEGIVEVASDPPQGKEFYIPHKPVIRMGAETTKLRIVYDASSSAKPQVPSLNDCLYAGPPLQNHLWSVLVRMRFHPVLITGDLQQAFLQVRIKEEERDALRFHWKTSEHSEVEVLRFTRALFGLVPSPFLLGGVIECHLETWETHMPQLVAELRKSLYVDDLISGKPTVPEAQQLKEGAIKIFADAKFTLHKWHSNVAELEGSERRVEDEGTFAKQQLGQSKAKTGGLLGLPWDKQEDQISVVLPQNEVVASKRALLRNLAKIYDPLGLAAPLTIKGKFIYRDVCNVKVAWDAPLPPQLANRWTRWKKELPAEVMVARALTCAQEQIEEIELHAFGDASKNGVCATVHAVVRQPSGVSQGLVTAKARLAKQGLTIPRLELVSAHMAANLITNVGRALQGFPVKQCYGWLDSSVALHWIKGGGEYKQFVANRVMKIQGHSEIYWRHVPTKENPADLGSRGGQVDDSKLWWQGPEWLSDKDRWPTDIVTSATPESQTEAKVTKELFNGATASTDCLDDLLGKFSLIKTLRIVAWAARFMRNSRLKKQERMAGPLTTYEINEQHLFWTKRAQEIQGDEVTEDRQRLGLKENEQGILVCRGRVQGHYPVYLPDMHPYTVKLVEEAHRRTLHGGVGLTMARIRERYWVPRLRRLTKKVIKQCYGCRRFQVRAAARPPPGNLPRDRTEGNRAFQVVGVDFAGPIKYRVTQKKEGKAYIILYACSLTRALYLELSKSMETSEFLRSLKRLIARKGRPEKIYSDNAKTFVAAASWLKQVQQDEQFHHYLSTENIQWQFNLSRAPWWGGQFERLVGLVKRSLNKTIGNGRLRWGELEDVLLDVEVTLNNRPLGYVEDDVQLPLITPNSMQFIGTTILPEKEPHRELRDLRKRAKYMKRCKDAMWTRWTKEYLRGLRERHNLKHDGKGSTLTVGDVVIVHSEDRNRGKWPLGIVEKLYTGRDGVVRGVKLRAGGGHLERAVNHLYPLELSCDWTPLTPQEQLNPEAREFRPTRDAAIAARVRMQDIADEEQAN